MSANATIVSTVHYFELLNLDAAPSLAEGIFCQPASSFRPALSYYRFNRFNITLQRDK